MAVHLQFVDAGGPVGALGRGEDGDPDLAGEPEALGGPVGGEGEDLVGGQGPLPDPYVGDVPGERAVARALPLDPPDVQRSGRLSRRGPGDGTFGDSVDVQATLAGGRVVHADEVGPPADLRELLPPRGDLAGRARVLLEREGPDAAGPVRQGEDGVDRALLGR